MSATIGAFARPNLVIIPIGIEALRSEIAEAGRQSLDFSVRNEAEEKRLANLISPFFEGKPNPASGWQIILTILSGSRARVRIGLQFRKR